MERKKKALFALGAIIVIAILVTCISKFGGKEEDTKKLATETATEVTDNTNQSVNSENKTENEEVQEGEKDNRPESLDAVKMLHANEDHTYISSEDLYDHMDKIVGYNFLTTATIDELTDKEVSLTLKEGKPSSVVFNTAEDYTKLVKSGDKVAVIGTLYEYNKVDGKKIATAWVSFIASGNDVEEYKAKTTDPAFIDLFE